MQWLNLPKTNNRSQNQIKCATTLAAAVLAFAPKSLKVICNWFLIKKYDGYDQFKSIS
jgi:hypothetical protein